MLLEPVHINASYFFVNMLLEPAHINASYLFFVNMLLEPVHINTRPRSAVGNMSGYRCVSDCRSRCREFDPGLVPYFCGD